MAKNMGEIGRALAIALGWHFPFFGIPAAALRWREDKDGRLTQTACVTADGTVYLNPAFCGKLSKEELQFVVAHEMLHQISLHFWRRGSRDPKLWNVAADLAINYVLAQSGFRVPDSALMPGRGQFPDEWAGWHAERIYDALQQDADARAAAQQAAGQDEGDGEPKPGAGCGPKPPQEGEGAGSGEGDSDQDGDQDGQGAGKRPSDGELERQWREHSAAAVAVQKQQGEGRGAALCGAVEIPDSKVNWQSILRRGTARALAVHGRDETTWMRRGRRSGSVGPQFPGWQATSARVAVVIDTSGSMSDRDLAQCIAETVKIAKQSGVAIYLVTHDHGVQWAGWLRPDASPEAIKRTMTGRGGTSAFEAYERVSEAGRRFDCFIHLTDGYLSWPAWPDNCRQKVVAIVAGDGRGVPEGARVIEVDPS